MTRICLHVAVFSLLISLSHYGHASGFRDSRDSELPVYGAHNETPIPQDLHGIWAIPDCKIADDIVVIAPHFALETMRDLVFTGAVQYWNQGEYQGDPLYYFETNNKTTLLIKKTKEGLLKIASGPVHRKQPPETAWGSARDSSSRLYVRCQILSDHDSGMSALEVTTPFLLEDVMQGCDGVTRENFPASLACHRALFHAADANDDQALDSEDLARLYQRVVFLYASLNTCNIGPVYPGNSVAEGKEFASAITGVLDTDHSGQISMDEVMRGIHQPDLEKGRIYSFIEKTRNLQLLLPFLPDPDSLKACVYRGVIDEKTLGTIPLENDSQIKQ